ncbi:MAG: hypothetical protein KF791_10800 [Verrucomicrobiae bacterium]|nr:hypothetical protein [Verrucomicrobiae bacterium]
MKIPAARLLPVLAAATVLLTGTALRAGSVGRLYYDNLSSSSSLNSVRIGLASLTNAARFPDDPSFREQLDDFTSLPGVPLRAGLQGKDNSGNDYGSWIRGYIEAPATGAYIFGIASDDNGALFLSTDHTLGNLRQIAFESDSGGSLFGGPRLNERNSAPINLVRGRKYYFEVLHKQGGGGAFIQVGWQRPDGIQEIIPALHLSQYPIDPFLGRFETNQPPIFNGSGFNQGSLPAAETVDEGAELLLALDVIAAQPVTYEWTRDGLPIEDEDLSFLRVARVPASWNGSRIRGRAINAFGRAETIETVLTVTPDTEAPVVLSAETGGNPNTLRITFSEPVDPLRAASVSNYEVRPAGGAALPIAAATLSADEASVLLSGTFNFVPGTGYSVTIRNQRDQATVPNDLAPNPLVVPFTFSAPTGTTYTFNNGRPSGFRFSGVADVVASGSHDGSGFLQLTDAFRNRNGAVLITERRNVDQVRVRFKARISDGASTTGLDEPGDGFSINLAGDLPLGTLPAPEEGFVPFAPGSRFSVTFDTHSDGSADPVAFGVVLNSQILTNVLAGSNGIPPITSEDGRWVDVDVDLRRNGQLTIRWDGVTVLDRFQTPFEAIPNAQLGFAARTRTWFQTHWIDDLNVNYSEGDFGDVGLAPESVIGGAFVEGSEVRLSAQPTGAGPFSYQWRRDSLPIAGATNRVLRFPATLDSGGRFSVVVRNDFSELASPEADVVIQPDRTPPQLVSVRGVAGGVNRVILTFDEPLDPVTATDTAVYSSPLFRVLSATLGSDGRSVILETTPQRSGITYPLSLIGLRDVSSAGNTLTESTSVPSTITYRDEVLGDDPVRYFRFEETVGTVAGTELASGDQVNTNGTYVNLPILGVPSLVPSARGEYATRFVAANTNYVAVPNGGDINDFRGPWAQRTIEFWFQADRVPAPGLTGLAATAGLYEEGGNLRSIHVHLWRDPDNQNPNESTLVFHAFNDTSDGPGAPFGLRGADPIYVTHTIRTGEVYHVVAVFDGRTDSFEGELRLYVNNVLVGRAGGIGQIYNHNGDIRIGSGNARIFLNLNGTFGSFDGTIDELSIYNSVLSEARIADRYRAGTGESLSVESPPTLLVGSETRGNPDQLRLLFNQPVSAETAEDLANYTLQRVGGGSLAVASAELLEDLVTVRLQGAFGFQPGADYEISVRGVADILAADNVIAPTNRVFTFTSAGPAGLSPASDLAARQVVENGVARFTAVATGEPPFQYQWFYNGAPIPNRTAPVLEFPATLGAAGSYSVTVSNEFSSVSSPAAVLTVLPDVEAPRIVRAIGIAGTLNEIRLSFSEPLRTQPAGSVAAYSIPGLTVTSAVVSNDGLHVTLKTSPQVHGQRYAVTVNGLLDRAETPNVLNATTSIVSAIRYREELLSENAVRYWTFDESSGSEFFTLISRLDQTPASLIGDIANGPVLGVPGLVTNQAGNTAVRFDQSTDNIILVPNGRDLNAILGPWPKRTHVFSFQANRLPRLQGTNAEAPAIFGHGRIGFYLYGTQDDPEPTEALLVFHAHNNASDGPGSPWGGTTGNPETAKYVAAPVRSGETYHVVGILDGDPNGFTGQLRLYVNGVSAGFVGGIGQLYRHPNNQPTFGQAGFLRHDGINVSIVPPINPPTLPGDVFDGVIDEFAILNQSLSAERVAQLHAFAQTPPAEGAAGPSEFTEVRIENGSLILTWDGAGRLERADGLGLDFLPVPGATSPYQEPVTEPEQRFFRLIP